MSSKRSNPLNIADPAEVMRAKKRKKSKQSGPTTSRASIHATPAREVPSDQIRSHTEASPIPTPVESRTLREKAVETEDGSVTVTFPAGTSAFGETDKFMSHFDSMIFPEDEELLKDKRGIEVADWGTARLYQLLQIHLHMKKEIRESSERVQNVRKAASKVKSELEEKKREVAFFQCAAQQAKEEAVRARAETESAREDASRKDAEIEGLKRQLDTAKAKVEEYKVEIEELTEEVNFVAAKAMLKTKATLMQEYKEGKHESWEPEKVIAEWEELNDDDEDGRADVGLDVELAEGDVARRVEDVVQPADTSMHEGDQRDGSTTDAGGRIEVEESGYQAE